MLTPKGMAPAGCCLEPYVFVGSNAAFYRRRARSGDGVRWRGLTRFETRASLIPRDGRPDPTDLDKSANGHLFLICSEIFAIPKVGGSMQSRGGFSAFEIYLRTGRRLPAGVEVKFNPWHDPENGRFTFANSGRYFGAGGQRNARQERPGKSDQLSASKRLGPRGRSEATKPGTNDAGNPRNHSVYIVKRGDTLSGIADQRKGLSVSGLAWLNGISADRPLQIGQHIRIPHQQYLEEGKRAFAKYNALQYYIQTHGGRLPADVANPPSVESQILDTNWRREIRNGYEFQIDVLSRTREVYGLLSFTLSPVRSRRSQLEAGHPDRRPGDDGGHYIAARFNGPRDGFNHFAQDANFNRGAYRALEGEWAKEMRAGHTVFVEIVPHYAGTSRRPDSIRVTWYVDGRRKRQSFPNEATRRSDDKR